MMYRLPPVAHEWLDRDRPLAFRFEGRSLQGFAGDTLSSALAGAGVMLTARSFKYHRPRGLYSAAAHDANNLFQSGSTPNLRGDTLPLRADLAFEAVNTHGGVARDRARLLESLAAFLPVGFYYKTAIHRRLFPHFEGMVRRLSGLGRVAFDARHEISAQRHEFCDVAVIGGGIAGLSAALAAARSAAVTLVEESARLGGSGLWARAAEPGRSELARELVRQVLQHPRISVVTSTCAVGCYADHLLALAGPARLTQLRAAAVVLASGAIEQPPVFANNDLPGVLLASAAQRLLYRHGVAAGRRVCLLVANRDGLEAALDLHAHGVQVAAIVELRADAAADADLHARLHEAGVRLLRGAADVAALPGPDGCIAALELAHDGTRQRIACDALLLSTGWMPAVQLALQAGASIRYDEAQQQLVPWHLPAGLFVAGRANGCFATAARARDGEQAGLAAAQHACGTQRSADRSADGTWRSRETRSLADPYLPDGASGARGRAFVDLDEDLTARDLHNALHEGFDSIELLKRYSTVGMGPSQGKLSAMNAARLVARSSPGGLPSLQLTTARPPCQPVTLALLAGRGFTPERRTALDAENARCGAVWMPAGNWRRPEYYRRGTDNRARCIEDEVRAVREAVGIIDVGTLGKIEVRGPDAARLLEHVYAGRYADMRPGTTRYALMLDDAGTVIDDGVVARLGVEHFYFTTTTSGSTTVYRELLRHVAERRFDCVLHNLTGHFGAINVAGPGARALLSVLTATPLDPQSFPYLAARQAVLLTDVEALLLRVGFVGELGYEIHLPAPACRQLWTRLLDLGTHRGLRPFGVEAQRVLRLEKGHLIVGQDTDGLTNPFEVNAAWAVRMEKPYFVGQRSLRILQRRGPRQQLVGFAVPSPDAGLREGHLVLQDEQIAGRITSIAVSPTLRQQIGLALVTPALAVPGGTLRLRGPDRVTTARIVTTPFYDPQQLRQHAPPERADAA